ncbi:hypothetical protein HMN09_01304800 [Mycena chlorophos]|uniref:Uncharacterized protein n=1 Tax=Mycena chlorophos TaxID=658473 RepID=A0A8H6RZR6_MYCCL|nr:hypothetical protein HMN09_01304800 [Mycena chlorophos]
MSTSNLAAPTLGNTGPLLERLHLRDFYSLPIPAIHDLFRAAAFLELQFCSAAPDVLPVDGDASAEVVGESLPAEGRPSSALVRHLTLKTPSMVALLGHPEFAYAARGLCTLSLDVGANRGARGMVDIAALCAAASPALETLVLSGPARGQATISDPRPLPANMVYPRVFLPRLQSLRFNIGWSDLQDAGASSAGSGWFALWVFNLNSHFAARRLQRVELHVGMPIAAGHGHMHGRSRISLSSQLVEALEAFLRRHAASIQCVEWAMRFPARDYAGASDATERKRMAAEEEKVFELTLRKAFGWAEANGLLAFKAVHLPVGSTGI